jgi:hypothetical protein
VVSLAFDGTVTAVRPKPARPDGDLVWGLFAGRVGALRELVTVDEPGDLWDRWARDVRRGRVRGVEIPGYYVDLGTRAALAAELDASADPPT